MSLGDPVAAPSRLSSLRATCRKRKKEDSINCIAQPTLLGTEDAQIPRITVRIADAVTMLGIGRSKVYELIGTCELETIKLGSATLILVESITALVERRRGTSAT